MLVFGGLIEIQTPAQTLKAEGHIFENCLKNKRCSAGCKLTWAALGTSVSILKNHWKRLSSSYFQELMTLRFC